MVSRHKIVTKDPKTRTYGNQNIASFLESKIVEIARKYSICNKIFAFGYALINWFFNTGDENSQKDVKSC